MRSQQRFAGIKSFLYLSFLVSLLLLLDQPSVRLVNGQLEAVGAVLSVVPVTSILTTAGLVGVKLAALSRLLQALGYDQAYLKSGNPGTAALPIGLQSNHAYTFPYVPGLNISVREEHGAQHKNDAAHLREAATHLATRKTFPAMGLPGDYESQMKPFRGSETLKDIFKSAGINVKFLNQQQQQQPMQQQVQKTNVYGQIKGKGQSPLSHSMPVAVTDETAKSIHESINLQPAKITNPSTTNHHDPQPNQHQQHIQTLPSTPTHENVAHSALLAPSLSSSLDAVGESRPHIPNPPYQPPVDPKQAAGHSSANRPSSSSFLMAPEGSHHPQQQGQPQQQLHIPQTHALQSPGRNSQVSLPPKPEPPSTAQIGPIRTLSSAAQPHSPLPVAPQPAEPPAPVQPAASSIISLVIPAALRPSPSAQQQHSSLPPQPQPPPPPTTVAVPSSSTQPATPNPPASLPATVATGPIASTTAGGAEASGRNQHRLVAFTGSVDPSHQVPQRELIYRKFLAELKANRTRDELLSLPPQQPVYAGPDPFHPVPQHEPFYKKFLAQFRAQPAQRGPASPLQPLPAPSQQQIPSPPPPPPQQPEQQQQQGRPEGLAVGSVVVAPSLQSGHLVRPPHQGMAHIPQKNLANFEDYNNILFGAGASPNSLQFSTISSSSGGNGNPSGSVGGGSVASASGPSSANSGNSGGGGSTLATGTINFFPNGHSASDIASNMIPTPFVTDGPPPFHDEMDQNEFNLVNMRRRRKRQIAGAGNASNGRQQQPSGGLNMADQIRSQAQTQSSRRPPSHAGSTVGGQQTTQREPPRQRHENFGMPAVNINQLRRRKRRTNLSGSKRVLAFRRRRAAFRT